MKKETKQELKIIGLAAFALFISISFIVTVAVMIFLRSIDLEESQIRTAAPFTFAVVVSITAIFVIAYAAIRYVTVIKPTRKIRSALEKISSGDFSEHIGEDGANGNFSEIIKHINRMNDELSSVETLKTDFISNVSHEIKTPISVVKNYGQLLLTDDISDDERKEYAAATVYAAERLNELISNILRLNRLENQRLQPKNEVYDISEQLRECILGFERIWEEKEIEINADIPDGADICSDRELLSLVWNNLLSNAFKFTDNGGRVSVKLSLYEEYASVSVADTGCGMSETTGRHIFDKFYQGDTSRAAQGNGLGLALVKRVIDLVGGEISVKSTLGKGSEFTVKILRNADGGNENE